MTDGDCGYRELALSLWDYAHLTAHPALLTEKLDAHGFSPADGPVEAVNDTRTGSKTCSSCGHVKADLTLGDRTYECGACGEVIDRDLNAAINLKNLAGSSPVSACRPGGSGSIRKDRVKPLVGQEPNTERGRSIPFGSV